MKRRDVLKGLAVAPVVAALPRMGEARELLAPGEVREVMSTCYQNGRMKVELNVHPDEAGKFASVFRERMEAWEAVSGEHFQPIEAVMFDLLEEDGSHWLVHPAWGRGPYGMHFPESPAMLYTEAHNVFRDRRWDIIDRAVSLRENGYWRQEHPPGAGPWDSWDPFLGWRRAQRARLHRVVVKFEAVPRGRCCERDHDEDGNCDRHRG